MAKVKIKPVFTSKSPGLKYDESELVAQIKDDFDTDVRNRETWLKERDRGLSHYYGDLPQKDWPWPGCANYCVPVTSVVVDALHSILFSRFRQANPLIKVKPYRAQFKERAELNRLYMTYQLEQELKIYEKLDQFIKDTLIDGTKVIFVGWEVDYRVEEREVSRPKTEYTVDPLTGETIAVDTFETVTQEIPVLKYSEARLYLPEIEDVFFPVHAQSLQWPDASHVIRRMRKPVDYLVRKARSGIYFGFTREELESAADSQLDSRTEVAKRKKSVHIGTEEELDKDLITLLEWYGRWDINNDGLDEDIVVTLVPRLNKIIRIKRLEDVSPHGKRPCVVFVPEYYSGRTFGLGVPRKVENTQLELNAVHNQRLDYGTIANMPFFFYTPTAILSETVGLSPGQGVPVMDINGVKFPSFSSNSAVFMQEEVNYVQWLERQTPISELRLGRSPSITGPSGTATGMVNLLEQSNVRLLPILARFEAGFKELLQHLHAFNTKYTPPGKAFRVLGDSGRDLYLSIDDPRELEGMFDFEITLGGNDRDVELQKAMMKYQLLAGNPLVNNNPIGLYEITKDMLKALGQEDTEKILPPLPPELSRNPMSPVTEHSTMLGGAALSPLPNENHMAHLSTHIELIRSPEFNYVPQPRKKLFLRHIQETMMLLQNQMMAQEGGRPGMSTPNVRFGSPMVNNMSQGFGPETSSVPASFTGPESFTQKPRLNSPISPG